MGRKCSNCGKIGHNSRTCPIQRRSNNINGGTMKLFGVQLHLSSSSSSSSSSFGIIKKNFSMDSLTSSNNFSFDQSKIPYSDRIFLDESSDKMSGSKGYLSDGLIGRSPEIRKKGMPWTEEEHKIFLVGLEKLGKGDWRGISRNFVTTRTPTQVASHAQKYFLRQNCLNNKIKRRPSLFDLEDEKDKSVISSEILQGQNASMMINFSSSEQDSKSDSQTSTPERPSFDSTESSHFMTIPSKSNYNPDDVPSTDPPNLELTLAAPQTLDQSKPSIVVI